jgi:hypothetical protein
MQCPILDVELRSMKSKTASRVALTRRDFAYFRWRYVANAERTFRALSCLRAPKDVSQIASTLAKRGISVAPSDQFLSVVGRKALADASEYILTLSRSDEVKAQVAAGQSNSDKGYVISLIPKEHDANSPLLKLALDPHLLKAVSLYLGLWPHLFSIGAWLNFPTEGDPIESQLWHRDPEDIKVVKAFIYLSDVDEDCGPFSYIPGTHPFGELAHIVPHHKDQRRVLDDEMEMELPAQSWMTCTGPAGTMVVADTVGYHRGGKPKRGNRVVITFTYTSGALFERPYNKRTFQVLGTPTWVEHGLQEYALRGPVRRGLPAFPGDRA